MRSLRSNTCYFGINLSGREGILWELDERFARNTNLDYKGAATPLLWVIADERVRASCASREGRSTVAIYSASILISWCE